MKIVIDIPEDTVDNIKNYGTFLNPKDTEILERVFHNSKPLDDVFDKIRVDVFNACSDNYHMPVYKLDCDEIFEIIDKYKTEGEVRNDRE